MTVTPKLKSEKVIINAPMSFAGSAQRAWRLRSVGTLPVAILTTPLVIVLIVLWWAVVIIWYLVFGLWLVPYRLLRRGARKRKAEALRHRELMAAVHAPAHTQPPVMIPPATAPPALAGDSTPQLDP